MKTRKPKPESEQSIPEMVYDVARVEMRRMYKDRKLAPFGQRGGNLAIFVAAF
ncbi:MAG: hypothetical protein ILM98_14960 [Kiritimatiellae bacterium]|nr:hypothetical protein [Kiritimatiellia bacterium]